MTPVEPSNSPAASSTSSQQQVKSTNGGGGGGGLWKRFGRRGSKSSASVNSATSSNNNDNSSINAEQSLAAKRAQRIMAGGPGPGLGGGTNDNSNNTKNNNNSSRRGRSRSREPSSQHSRGIFGKIRDSVRGQRSISVGGGDEDGNGNGSGKIGLPTRMSASKNRSNSRSRRHGNRSKSSGRKNPQLPPPSSEALQNQNSLNSPSYSTDSYQTVEVSPEQKVKVHSFFFKRKIQNTMVSGLSCDFCRFGIFCFRPHLVKTPWPMQCKTKLFDCFLS